MKSYYDAVKFFKKYSQYDKAEDWELYLLLRKHVKYGTIIILYDNNEEITALARWDIVDGGRTSHVLDCIIRPDVRGVKMISKLLKEGIRKSGNINKVTWERLAKYPDKEQVTYKVKET